MRRVRTRVAPLLAIAIAIVVLTIWGGPLTSGAIFLVWPAAKASAPGLPPNFPRAVHQGHVDLSTGLYIHEDDDAVLDGAVPFVWRRTYVSGDHLARAFGLGATHNGEWYLIGEADTFRWVELMLADGSRIHFDRASWGNTYHNAMFRATATPSLFSGARLGWTGLDWALRFRDGSLARFRACGAAADLCSLESLRDVTGGTVWFRRDRHGLLRHIESGPQRLVLDYDDQRRIIRASTSPAHAVEYSYDAQGRLARVDRDGVTQSFEYGLLDQLVAVRGPDRLVENTYDEDGRLIRQVVHNANGETSTENFAYTVEGVAVIAATVTAADGGDTRYRFDDRHLSIEEVWSAPGADPVTLSFSRDDDGWVQTVTVVCAGRRAEEAPTVPDGDDDRVKRELVARVCQS